MSASILVALVGICVAGAGLYYLSQSKDAESRKIYGIAVAVGAVIAVAGIVFLLI